MKIQNQDPVSRLKDMLSRLDQADRTNPARSAEQTPKAGAAATKQDEVQLSGRAREIHRMREEIASSPDVRQSIVDKLKTDISSGQYRIDGTLIADQMLKED